MIEFLQALMHAVDLCMKKLLSDIMSTPAFASLASSYASLVYILSRDYSASRIMILNVNDRAARKLFLSARHLRYCLVSSLYAQTGESGLMMLIVQADLLTSSPKSVLSILLDLAEEAHFLVFCEACDQLSHLNHAYLFQFSESVLSADYKNRLSMLWMNVLYLYLRQWLECFENHGVFDSVEPVLFSCPLGYPLYRLMKEGRFAYYRESIGAIQNSFPECLYRLNALPYMHILKQVLRNKIGRFSDVEEVLYSLQETLSAYVSDADVNRFYHLSAARVTLSKALSEGSALFVIELCFPQALSQNFKLSLDYVSKNE